MLSALEHYGLDDDPDQPPSLKSVSGHRLQKIEQLIAVCSNILGDDLDSGSHIAISSAPSFKAAVRRAIELLNRHGLDGTAELALSGICLER